MTVEIMVRNNSGSFLQRTANDARPGLGNFSACKIYVLSAFSLSLNFIGTGNTRLVLQELVRDMRSQNIELKYVRVYFYSAVNKIRDVQISRNLKLNFAKCKCG